MAKEQSPTKSSNQSEQAEFKYVGDDGGRWLFQRRSDGLCFTIDKPRGVNLTATSPAMSVLLTVRGKKFRPEILSMVKR